MQSFIAKVKNHPQAKVLFAIASIILLFTTYKIYIWANTQSTDNAYIEADISNISSEVSGVIEKVLVKENNLVKAGQIIAKIKDDDYRARLKQSEAALEATKRDIEIIEQNIRLSTIEQNKTTETYEFADENEQLVEVNYRRVRELSKDHFASKQNLDNSKIAFERAKNELSQAMLNMQISTENLALLEIKKLAAIAKQSNAEQENKLAKRALDNTNIYSPIDGMIGNSALREGNYIRAGVILFSVVPINELYIKANFKETQITNFKTGMKAVITIDSIPGVKISGSIRNISPATGSKFSLLPPANATGNFTKIVQRIPVLIDLQIPEDIKHKIIPGMSSLVKIRMD